MKFMWGMRFFSLFLMTIRAFFRRSVFILLVLACVSPAAELEEKYLIAVGDAAYPPLEYLDENGKPTGFNVDVFKTVMKRLGLDCEIRLLPWEEAMDAVRKGKADLFLDLGFSEERAREFEFAQSHNYLNACALCRKDLVIRNMSDLDGLRIVVQRDEITARHVKGLNLRAHIMNAPNAERAVRAVAEGRADVFICNSLIAEHYAVRSGRDLSLVSLQMLPAMTTVFAGAKKPGMVELLRKMCEAERAMRRDGSWLALYKKWYVSERSVNPVFVRILVIGFLVFIFVITLFFVFHVQRLQKRAHKVILSGVRVPMCLVERSGHVVSTNPAFDELFGAISPKDICARALPCPFGCARPLDERCAMKEAFDTGREVERTLHWKNRVFKMGVVPITDRRGRALRVVDSFTDVTDLLKNTENDNIVKSCLETALREFDVNRALTEVLKRVCTHTRAAYCHVMRFDLVQNKVICVGEYCVPGVKPLFDNRKDFLPYPSEFSLVDRYTTSEYVGCPDLAVIKDRTDSIVKAVIQENKLTSFHANRIMLADKPWGFFSLCYNDGPHASDVDEQRFLSAMAHAIELLILRDRWSSRVVETMHRAQKAERAKSDFIASVSHEIRTPLNAIIGFSELLHDHDMPPKEQKDYLESINFSGNTLLQLVNDVLDLSKLDADRMMITPEPVDFAMLGHEVLQVFFFGAKTKSLHLACDIPALPRLNLDKLRVRQILFNLISNAVKFTSAGSVTLTASFTPDTKELCFSVSDTGPGIAEADQSRIMEPFIQLERAHGVETGVTGTGLGLAITRRLIEKMNGTMSLESELGKGSTFRVTLRDVGVTSTPVQALAPHSSLTDAVKTTVDRSGEILLLVDDVQMNLKVMTALCRRAGISRILNAGSGPEALALMRQTQPTMIFTDMWMPGMNGAELAAEIKAIPHYASVPIISVTADVEARKNFSQGCFAGTLLKPVTFEKLNEAINLASAFRAGRITDGSGIVL